MRSQREVKLISAQLEFLEERKNQAEGYGSEINSVIDLCKSWMEEKEESPTSFRDLLKLCLKMTEMCPNDVDCQSSRCGHGNEMKENTAASTSLGSSTTARKQEENNLEKILTRLNTLENTVSSMSSSHKVTEENISKVKRTIESAIRNMNQKLKENEENADQARREESEQMKDLQHEVKRQSKKIKSLTKSLQEIEEQNQRLVHEISTCNDAIDLVQSKYSGMSNDLETVTCRCKELDSDFISLKSSLQSLDKSCDIFKSAAERMEKKQNERIEPLQAKVQTLQEQIEHLKSEKKLSTQGQGLPNPPIGFLASYFSSPEETISKLSGEAQSYAITQLDKRHEVNTELILSCFRNIFFNSECDYSPSSGIFKVRQKGLYLIYADICDVSENTKHIYVGMAVRRKNKIVDFAKYATIPVVKQAAKVMTVLHLRKGQEICILKDERSRDSAPIGDFACILLV